MGLTVDISVPVLTVFLQGLLSFFSPCVLPLVPMYVGYLSGGARTTDEDGAIHYRRGRVLLNTFFFVLGISFAFFVLGLGFSAAGRFFSGNQAVFARVGGIVVVLFGLYQLGLFGPSQVLAKERRLPFRLDRLAMNPLTALLLGFLFSFAWTPCVGPALTGVLLMASSASSQGMGFLLIGVYTLGFVLPFLGVGLFTGALLNFFKTHQRVVRYTVKIGGVLLVLMGVMMITGWMNSVTGYLSGFGPGADTPPAPSSDSQSQPTPDDFAAGPPDSASSQPEPIPAPDFTLTDQLGAQHTLSDYKGQVVFLNFWATWCGPCQREMPDIQAIYEEYGYNGDEVVILGVAGPRSEEVPATREGTQAEVIRFLAENGYTYPTAMDMTGEVFAAYGVQSLPTTFMIDKEGNVFGYVPGMVEKAIMADIIRQTLESTAGTTP